MLLATALLACVCLCRAAAASGEEAPSWSHENIARAALAIVPASLIDGRPETAFDERPSAVPVAVPGGTAGSPLVPGTRTSEDALVALIDELSLRDPALFDRIQAEEARIRALPTREERAAAVDAAYPILERDLDRSAAEGRLSRKGAAAWSAFRVQAKESLADGTLLEKAEFAGKTFDARVRALLARDTRKLDANRTLPETRDEYMAVSKRIHAVLNVPGNSTALTTSQLDEVFGLVGAEFGIRPEFLKYMAKTESGLHQTVPSNPAASGIMQIERVHKDAYAGARNVGNDTVTNIVYGGLLRAETDREMARRYVAAGLEPPSSARVVEFLGDLGYNRGLGLLSYVAKYAAQQKIDVNKFSEYIGGRGGSYEIVDGGKSIRVIPGPGTGIDRTGKNSVLALASDAVGRVQFSQRFAAGVGDRNGDGRVDHLDVWLTRGVKYLDDPALQR